MLAPFLLDSYVVSCFFVIVGLIIFDKRNFSAPPKLIIVPRKARDHRRADGHAWANRKRAFNGRDVFQQDQRIHDAQQLFT